MRKVSISAYRKEVVAIIESNRDKVTSFEAKHDYSIFTFCGKEYACEVQISPKWFGVDLGIDTPEAQLKCGLEDNDDGYMDEEVQAEVFDEIIKTVQAIFDGRVKYLSTSNYSYTVRMDLSGTYCVRYSEKKKLLWLTYSSGWYSGEMSKSEYDSLKLTSLQTLS